MIDQQPISYSDIEAAYSAAKMGDNEPVIAYMTPKVYWSFVIASGRKVPRKLKKWAIGTRRSRRRRELQWMRIEQRMKRQIIEITIYKEDIQVVNNHVPA